MIIHDVEQQTEEWFAIREGKMTASHADAIGNNGAGLKTYSYEIVSKKHSDAPRDSYTNKDMERGNELEDQARELYGLTHGVEVETVGFIEHSEHVGCSPDGLVGEKGGVEIKCKNDVKHLKNIVLGEKEIESKYIWQIQMCLLITGRDWWDYIAYNPNFKNSMFVHRFYPDEEKFAKLLAGFESGEAQIKEIENKLLCHN